MCVGVFREHGWMSLDNPMGIHIYLVIQCKAHLVIQHQQQCTVDVHIPRSLHLEAIRLLGGGGPVPLLGYKHMLI